MADDFAPTHPTEPPARPPRRRSYTSPRLIEYGSVAKLTRGSMSVESDWNQAGFKKMS